MKTYLILGDANERQDYGEHWALVEGHSPEDACERYYGEAGLLALNTQLLVVPWPAEGTQKLGVKSKFVPEEEYA